MKTRSDLYGREAASLLRDITMYRVLTGEQLLRLYPGKQKIIENLLPYLVKQGRVHLIDGLYCAAPECAEEVDRALLAAVWVLVDFISQVEYHSISDYPAKLCFFANQELYQVIHAEQGKEIMLSNVLADTGEEPPRCLVLVDDPAQIEQLQIPNAAGFCTVTPDGTVQYFQKE